MKMPIALSAEKATKNIFLYFYSVLRHSMMDFSSAYKRMTLVKYKNRRKMGSDQKSFKITLTKWGKNTIYNGRERERII